MLRDDNEKVTDNMMTPVCTRRLRSKNPKITGSSRPKLQGDLAQTFDLGSHPPRFPGCRLTRGAQTGFQAGGLLGFLGNFPLQQFLQL